MSDLNDWMEGHQGQIDFTGHLVAIQQRNRQIAQQQETTSALRAQTAALERQTRIEQDRASLERHRLEIERQRFEAEAAEREHRRLQTEQIKQLRSLMADMLDKSIAIAESEARGPMNRAQEQLDALRIILNK